MRALIGLLSLVGGLVIWGLAISALVSWLAFCFGSVIIGILLLIFAPYALLAPLAIGVPGTALFMYGIDCIANKKEEKHDNVIEADVVWQDYIAVQKAEKEIYDAMSAMNAKDGCTTDEMPEGIGEFGLEPTNPIPVNTVTGSMLYLGGLRAPDGTRVNNERLGCLKVENIQKLIDKYLITHENGKELAIIYISPYQAKNSKKAPKGLEQVSPLL